MYVIDDPLYINGVLMISLYNLKITSLHVIGDPYLVTCDPSQELSLTLI